MPENVHHRTQSVQERFLKVQQWLAEGINQETLLAHIREEPPLYRSIALESASMGVAWRAWQAHKTWEPWLEFAAASGPSHVFHLDIGLGWAMGKAGVVPLDSFWETFPVLRSLVLDGMGYYYALYRGRRTLKQQWQPLPLPQEAQGWFDQGIGRRMWYVCQGRLSQLTQLLEPFGAERQAGLWRGLGIAIGYVGGTDSALQQQLKSMAPPYQAHLQQGIVLAGISRLLSDSFDAGTARLCEELGGSTKEDLQSKLEELPEDWFSQRHQLSVGSLFRSTQPSMR